MAGLYRCGHINSSYFVVFDFETTGLSPETSEVIQVAGKAYDPRTLDAVPLSAGGEFSSMMRVLRPERLDDEGVKKALAVNKKTKEEILAAPEQALVWREFVAWVNKFNPSRKFTAAPIACGKNIRNFDLKFVEVLNGLHCPKKSTMLFSTRTQVDLEDLILLWFENDRELENWKMDTLREYFGMSTDGAHDALQDVIQTGTLIMRFLKMHRELRRRVAKDGSPFIKLKGSLSGIC